MTTPAPFAALEAETAATVFDHLSNAVLTFGAAQVAGILDVEPDDVFDHVAGHRTVFSCRQDDATGLVAGTRITIADKVYVIKQTETEDGIARLYLKDAA